MDTSIFKKVIDNNSEMTHLLISSREDRSIESLLGVVQKCVRLLHIKFDCNLTL